MASPEGFEFKERATGDVAIFHHGRLAKLLRGAEAKTFLAAVKKGDAQALMADAAGGPGGSRPGGGVTADGKALGGDGRAHGHSEFRRKSG